MVSIISFLLGQYARSSSVFLQINFVNFQKILAAHQTSVPKIFRKFTKKAPVAKSYFSKVAGFYRSSHLRCFVKNGVLGKVFTKFTGKQLCQRLSLINKDVKKRHRHRCFPKNFATFLRTPFLQNTSGRLLVLLAFPCNFTKMGLYQQCFENLR